MINLLPSDIQEQHRRERTKRVSVVLLHMVTSACVAGVVLLASVYVRAEAERRVAELTLRDADDGRTSEEARAKETLARARELLERVPGRNDEPIYVLVDEIVARRPQGVTLDLLLFAEGEGGPTIELEGQSATREALIGFQKALREAGFFRDVELPISNLARDKDIVFSITLAVVESET